MGKPGDEPKEDHVLCILAKHILDNQFTLIPPWPTGNEKSRDGREFVLKGNVLVDVGRDLSRDFHLSAGVHDVNHKLAYKGDGQA